MRYFFSCVLIALLSFGLLVNEASAKRFGGGRSFGVQRAHSSLFSSNKTAPVGKQFNKSKWGGVLGGMLAGGLLASLFMGHGFASGIMSWLLLAAAAYFILNFIRRRQQPIMQGAQANPFKQTTQNSPFNQYYAANTNSTTKVVSEDFIREAKVTFIRLQTAYDQKNISDLQSFTLPEVFAEIQMQLDERGNEPNRTEVINLNAELLNTEVQANSKIASVRFTGTIKENNETNSLDEIWHFRQFGNAKEWLVGGIQQEVFQP